MTKEQFDSYIENMKVAEELKNCWKEIQIDWETDPAKIDLLRLHNGDMFKRFIEPGVDIRLRVEIVKMSRLSGRFGGLFDCDLIRYVELYKLIKKGTKMIPPISMRFYPVEDGEARIPNLLPIDICDGSHRMHLCHCLNIEEIPILIIDIPSMYTFSRAKWDIECDEKNIFLTHKEQNKSFSLSLKDHHGTLDSSGNYVFLFLK